MISPPLSASCPKAASALWLHLTFMKGALWTHQSDSANLNLQIAGIHAKDHAPTPAPLRLLRSQTGHVHCNPRLSFTGINC